MRLNSQKLAVHILPTFVFSQRSVIKTHEQSFLRCSEFLMYQKLTFFGISQKGFGAIQDQTAAEIKFTVL